MSEDREPRPGGEGSSEPRDRRPFVFSDVSLAGAFLWLIALPTIGLMINWDGLNRLALAAAHQLF